MPGDDKRSGPPATERPLQVPPGTEAIVSHRLDAQRRVEAQTRHLRVCRWLDRLAPLSVYYRHPKGDAYCRVVESWRP